MSDATAPLQELLDSVLGRLCTLEAKVGIDAVEGSSTTGATAKSTPTVEIVPFIKAYDDYIKDMVDPFVESIKALKPDDKKINEMAQGVKDAWMGVRTILWVASQSKKPSGNLANTELSQYLKPIQNSISSISKLRLDRNFDNHQKAILELCGALSWILIIPPPTTPKNFVEEAKSSCMYWANKVHKEYKNKTDDDSSSKTTHLSFYKCIVKVGNGLSEYVQQHHLTGLTWNPKGVDLSEAKVEGVGGGSSALQPTTATTTKPVKAPAVAGAGGGVESLMAELQKKQTADGSSAATGLKHVSRDQQTWRKEYKGEKSAVIKAEAATTTKSFGGNKKQQQRRGKPLFEYQTRGHKWVIEHYTKETLSADNNKSLLEMDITDSKQQVYIYNCDGITIQIKGKVKSIVLDRCTSTAVVFESCISAVEIVNSEKIQIQTTGICPTFTIDKTDGVVLYLSKESSTASSFVTSQSSEMNINYPSPDSDDEMIEVPIPEQFIHKLNVGGGDGKLSSEVSDLYH